MIGVLDLLGCWKEDGEEDEKRENQKVHIHTHKISHRDVNSSIGHTVNNSMIYIWYNSGTRYIKMRIL